MKTLLLLLICVNLYAQDTLLTEDYSVIINNSKMFVEDANKQIIHEITFNNPNGFLVDLDEDGADELIVNDFTEDKNHSYYTLYLFSPVDSFILIDSIYSGLTEPYYTFSDEIKGYMLITGSPDFDEFALAGSEYIFSPLVCWSYTDEGLTIINDQLYDVYIQENDKILSFINSEYSMDGKSCEESSELKQAIATVYTNFYHAGEKTNAENFLRNYYLCKDITEFKNKLKELL